jgi:armadillo repeat-containing protein 6
MDVCMQIDTPAGPASGPAIMAQLLEVHEGDAEVAAAVGKVTAAAVVACEDSKCAVMDSEFPARALAAAGNAGTPVDAALALLGALRGAITADDFRPPTSKAFMHARVLALDRGAVPVFLSVLRRAAPQPALLRSAVPALQALCANDNICMRVRFVFRAACSAICVRFRCAAAPALHRTPLPARLCLHA